MKIKKLEWISKSTTLHVSSLGNIRFRIFRDANYKFDIDLVMNNSTSPYVFATSIHTIGKSDSLSEAKKICEDTLKNWVREFIIPTLEE